VRRHFRLPQPGVLGHNLKQIDKETDAKAIGYGGMLIECLLAVLALIAVSSLGGQPV
jgi:carbon starvation protein